MAGPFSMGLVRWYFSILISLKVWALGTSPMPPTGQTNEPFSVPAIEKTVIVYCAQDEVLAEPLLREFTRTTGCEVRAVYDSEAVKTVGLANRLLAEKDHPVADLFWGNEEFRTRWLAAQQVFQLSNGWASFGTRTRRLIMNTNRLTLADAPVSLTELTNARWKGRVSLAFPLFGTTATHLLTLRQAWGREAWLTWCGALKANHPFLEEGNSQVVARVGRGEAWVGFTDSDDAAAGQREGLPVIALPIEKWTLAIPNTVGIIRNARHPRAAEALRRYLGSRQIIDILIRKGGLETADLNPLTLHPDWDQILKSFPDATRELERLFQR